MNNLNTLVAGFGFILIASVAGGASSACSTG